MKKLLLFITAIAISMATMTANNKAHAQKEQGEVVISAGVGWGLGTAIITGLIEAAFDSSNAKVTTVPTLNAMVDYGMTDNFSVGLAYTYNSWSFEDTFYETDTAGNTTTTEANAKLSRQNIGIRPLFHFGDNEDMDLYAGGRFGYSFWKLSYDVENTDGESESGYDAPGGVFSVQALFGVRSYFNDIIGVHFEVGIGTAPYFVAGGISLRL